MLDWPEGEARPIERRAPVKRGVWNAVHDSVCGRTLELLVNGQHYSTIIPPISPSFLLSAVS